MLLMQILGQYLGKAVMDNQVQTIKDVEFGLELPSFLPDTSLENVKRHGKFVGWGTGRFVDHQIARDQGFSGAIIPGVMSQGFLGAMIHRWAPNAIISSIDTIFRAPVFVDQAYGINGVVTDIDEERSTIELDITITNERNETRVFGTATLYFPDSDP